MSISIKNVKDSPLSFEGESSRTLTQPQFAKMQGTSELIRRALSGDCTVYRRGGQFVDTTIIPSTLQQCLDLQIKARDSYYALPDKVRARYTSPMAFFEACHNPNEIDTLKALGLVNATVNPSVTTPSKAEGANPPNDSPAPNT